MNRVSVCKRDLCVHVEGQTARQFSQVLMGIALGVAVIYAVKALS